MNATDTSTVKQPEQARIFDIDMVRADFPILNQQVYGQRLVYLDNAATAQKPQAVIDAISDYYQRYNANVHRGAHYLSELATQAFEDARRKMAQFIGASDAKSVIWTRGTTEAINLVANSWGEQNIQAGDEIIVSTLEHHSNIVPWQMLAARKGAKVVPIPVLANGQLDMAAFRNLLTERCKLVAIGHISNAIGVINPIEEIIETAHNMGAKVLVDGAQAAPHYPIDVSRLKCDFYALSGHKMFAPTGIGILYGKPELLDEMPPWQGGGEMIERVSFEATSFNKAPFKFEAGTPNIEGAVGMAAAVDYLAQFNRSDLIAQEEKLLAHATNLANSIAGLKIEGHDCPKTSVLSFNIEGCHSADLGMMLDQQGIAVRTGHHCAMPLMQALKVSGTVRASFSFYNTLDEVDALFAAIDKAKSFFA